MIKNVQKSPVRKAYGQKWFIFSQGNEFHSLTEKIFYRKETRFIPCGEMVKNVQKSPVVDPG